MRTTVTLDDDVFQAAKALSLASGRQLGQVLSQLARRGLAAKPSTSARNGLPVFKVPAQTPVIPTTRAAEMLADDSA